MVLPPRRPVDGFTLIELLVVISIIAVLAGILMPALSTIREASRSAVCCSNLRQIGMAISSYSADWNGQMCPSSVQQDSLTAHPELGPSYTWSDAKRVGGHLDGQDTRGGIYVGTLKGRPPWACPVDKRAAGSVSWGTISYGLNMHHYPYHYNNDSTYATLWTRTTPMRRMRQASLMVISTDTQEWRWFARSTINTTPPTLYYSDPNLRNCWSFPPSDTQAPNHMYGRHKGGSNLLFADGHVAHSTTLPADVTARRVYLRLGDIP